jgi:probable rRNA maturation factor
MSSLNVHVALEDDGWSELGFNPENVAQELCKIVCEKMAPFIESACEISVLLTNDKGIRPMNATYRGKDAPTNVLSFGVFETPLTQEEWTRLQDPERPFLIGDLVFSLDTLKRESALEEKSVLNHFSHLVVHGTLHLLGHDHMHDEEAALMEGLECEILAGVGISNPYIIPESKT